MYLCNKWSKYFAREIKFGHMSQMLSFCFHYDKSFVGKPNDRKYCSGTKFIIGLQVAIKVYNGDHYLDKYLNDDETS